MLHRRHLSGVGVDGIVGECSASANRRGLDAGGPQGGIGSLGGLRDLDGTHPTAFEWIFPVQTWWLMVEKQRLDTPKSTGPRVRSLDARRGSSWG